MDESFPADFAQKLDEISHAKASEYKNGVNSVLIGHGAKTSVQLIPSFIAQSKISRAKGSGVGVLGGAVGAKVLAKTLSKSSGKLAAKSASKAALTLAFII